MAEKRRTRENPSSPGGDARIEEYLDQRGVQWTFVPKVPTSEFDIERSINNNASFVAIDQKRVEQYTEAMRRGDEFPLVIAHKQGGKYLTADGNHHLVGADQARKALGVYDVTVADTRVTRGCRAPRRHLRSERPFWPRARVRHQDIPALTTPMTTGR